MAWQDRVKKLMAEQGFNQKSIAERLDITAATVSLWLGHKIEFSNQNIDKIQYRFADCLGTSKEYIETGVDKKVTPGMAVPLFKYTEVESWLNGDDIRLVDKSVFCPKRCGEKTYAVKMKGSLMDDKSVNAIVSGDIVFIDPSIEKKDSSLCMLLGDAPLIGIYEEFNGQDTVSFRNDRFHTLYESNFQYLGTVIGSFRSF